jgi:hypothetical protein
MKDLIVTEINPLDVRLSPLTEKGRSIVNALKSNYTFDTKNIFRKYEFDTEMKYRKSIGEKVTYLVNIGEQE